MSGDRQRGAELAFWGVSSCFVLSGVAGLVYQTVWMRTLATVFGTSEVATVTVLVAYMGGLAAGAGIASRLLDRLRRPILVYALLELAIAASALFVPWLLRGVGRLHVALMGGQPVPPGDGGVVDALAFLGLGCLVLAIPTACMGATLPILARGVVHRSEQIGRRIGWLYALNTLGAVAGTVLGAFLLIPALGLWRTALVGVALNLLVAVLGWMIAMRAASPALQARRAPQGSTLSRVVLVLMLISGAVAFAYEVLWARLLAFVLGGSLQAFATMLAAFLTGIAIGGLVGARIATDRRRSLIALGAVQIGTGLLTAIVFASVDRWSVAGTLSGSAALCVLVLLPATLCLGTTFPLAVRSLTDDPADAGRFAGRVYAWNTVGAIVGAVGAGYFLIPAIGFAGTFRWAVAINLLLGLVALSMVRPRLTRGVVAAALLVLVSIVLYRPAPPLGLMTLSPLVEPDAVAPELVDHAIGRSATVAVLRRQGSYLLRTNGLPEAEIFPRGAGALSYTWLRWLPALPKVLRPESDSMLVVGLGGGTLLESLPRGLGSIDVIELEPEVLRANERLAPLRAVDPLQDARVNVILNDARGALELTDKRYDVIVSQPSHPWTAGASHLYTREFLQLAREHMTPHALFVQWIGTPFVDERLLRSFCATVLAVFPHAQLYLVHESFVFVASPTSLEAPFLGGARADGSLIDLSDFPNIGSVEDVLAALQLDESAVRELAANAPPITDDRNLMATHHRLGADLPGSLADPAELARLIGPLHHLNREPRPLLDTLPVDFAYLTKCLQASRGALDRRHFFEQVVPDSEMLLLQAEALSGTDRQQAIARVEAALARDPDNVRARVFDVQLRLDLPDSERPSELSRAISGDPKLVRAVSRLTPEHRAVIEAQYWTVTDQLTRVRDVAPALAAIDDPRDPLFAAASELRLRLLLDPTGKSEAQQYEDLPAAAELLDELLARTLLQSAPRVSRRIALAHRLGDLEFLTATAWLLARKRAESPPEGRQLFSDLLAGIFEPYASDDGLTEPAIAELRREMLRQLGPGALSD